MNLATLYTKFNSWTADYFEFRVAVSKTPDHRVIVHLLAGHVQYGGENIECIIIARSKIYPATGQVVAVVGDIIHVPESARGSLK